MQDKQNSNLTKDMANDSRIFDICEIIGEQFGLHIDQVSELDSEIRGIFLGINKSDDFIDHIISRLEIDKELAQKIANEVSTKIYVVLKEKIQSSILNSTEEIKPTKPSHITDLEKAGGFTIEHDMGNREAGLGIEDIRAMPTRDKWSPFGQTVVPMPSRPTEAEQTILKSNNTPAMIQQATVQPTKTAPPSPVIINTAEAKEAFVKESVVSSNATPTTTMPTTTTPAVDVAVQKVAEVIESKPESKIETKIEPEVEVKEEVVVSTVPDNLPIEPVTLPKAVEETPTPKEPTVLPKAVEETPAPREPENNSLAETIINLRRIKDALPKQEIEQIQKTDQPVVTPVQEQTKEPLQTIPEPIIPEKIPLNPGTPKPVEQQQKRSFDPYREPLN